MAVLPKEESVTDTLEQLRIKLTSADEEITTAIADLHDQQDKIRLALAALRFEEPAPKARVISLPKAERPEKRQREVGSVPVDDALALLAHHRVPVTVDALASEYDASRVMMHNTLRQLQKDGLATGGLEGWKITKDGRKNWTQFRAKEIVKTP